MYDTLPCGITTVYLKSLQIANSVSRTLTELTVDDWRLNIFIGVCIGIKYDSYKVHIIVQQLLKCCSVHIGAWSYCWDHILGPGHTHGIIH